MSHSIRRLLAALRQVTSFEEAADQALAHIMDTAAGDAPAMDARLLRGMVHLRPRDAYEGIRVREADAPGAADLAGPGSLAPSTTAWLWVKHVQDAVLLDVGQPMAYDARGAIVQTRSASWQTDFRSREAILERHASRIAAMPLRRPGGKVDGFVSIEMAPASAGAGSIPQAWSALAPALQTLVDVAAPFLCDLPQASQRAFPVDDLLPVVGAGMQRRVALLRQVARTSDIVLLLGETGVGKTRLARWCHAQSTRASGPFVDARSLTGAGESLGAGELFGWEKGAFTTAHQTRMGLVAEAEGGTLFLDEIDKLTLQAQTMLLRLLEDGTYRSLGASGERKANVRFLVATNANLEEAVAEKRFLPDLYHRIQVLPMYIPALRERRDEIAGWAQHLLGERHRESDTAGEARLEQAACALLERQDWPGNLRQLNNVIKRAYILAGEGDGVCIRAAHIQQALDWGAGGMAPSANNPESALWDAFGQAAAAYVEVARARAGGLSLEHAKALGGLIMNEAVGQTGELVAAMRLLGRERALSGDNQHKAFHTQWKHVTGLAEALGLPAPAPHVRSRRHKP